VNAALRSPSSSFWCGKRVLVTGHTGFKGSWLCMWLHALGAEVHGFALDPPTTPSLYEVADVAGLMQSDVRADLADLVKLRMAVESVQPEVVLHLAAQPLVRESYADPVGTFRTNVLGTAHVLEAVRHVDSVRAVVVVTTDKVYENREWLYPYRENDRLGGHDPYSASKAAAELVVDSYRKSFFSGETAPRIATARAGNVIGGGDWAADRLVPDCLRAFQDGKPVRIRYPDAVRPWQHVLEPLCGYLLLAEDLFSGAVREGAWNFGPDSRDNRSVGEIANETSKLWGGNAVVDVIGGDHPHEAGQLRLDASLAVQKLGWKPRCPVAEALMITVAWHKAWLAGEGMREVSVRQIEVFSES